MFVTGCSPSDSDPEQAWFLRLKDILSRLLVKGKRNAITFDINAIALFRQAIGSSPARNDGTARPESSWGNSACDDEVLHRVMIMLKESTFINQVVTVVVDTDEDYIENDGGSEVVDIFNHGWDVVESSMLHLFSFFNFVIAEADLCVMFVVELREAYEVSYCVGSFADS
nr:hypothetical protein [Tanacetum cinerariifolium]GEX33076.1 hypothetical protein [Tanacetum cinerariifolium]